MTKRHIQLLADNKDVGYVEGKCSEKFESVLVDAYKNGWSALANKIPSSKSTNVYLITSPAEGFYKEFLARNSLEKFKARLVGSRCARHIAQSEILSKKGFDTPNILASGRLGKNEFIVSEAVKGVSFGEYLCSKLRQTKSKKSLQKKRLLFSQLGKFVGRLHKAGIIHGDLRPNNLLLVFKEKQPSWYVIDNERNQLVNRPTRKQLVKNLVQINMFHALDMTMTDRRRFFQGYLSAFQPQYDARGLEKEVIVTAFDRLRLKPVVESKRTHQEEAAASDEVYTDSEMKR